METTDVLADAVERTREGVRRLCDDLPDDALTWRPAPEANTIAWLVWHTGRVGDAQIADLADREEIWTADGWFERLDLPFESSDTGFGHTPEQVGQVRPDSSDLLVDYVDAVVDFSLEYVRTVQAEGLDRIVDHRWDPPVSAGVRLVSIVNDQAQHIGQAAYVRGLYERAHS